MIIKFTEEELNNFVDDIARCFYSEDPYCGIQYDREEIKTIIRLYAAFSIGEKNNDEN